MATVNKHSLREEFDRLKAEFEHLSATDQMSAEIRALFKALLMLFRGADGDLHGEDHRQGQPQFEPPALANQQGRDRGNPTRRQEQRRAAKRCADHATAEP